MQGESTSQPANEIVVTQGPVGLSSSGVSLRKVSGFGAPHYGSIPASPGLYVFVDLTNNAEWLVLRDEWGSCHRVLMERC